MHWKHGRSSGFRSERDHLIAAVLATVSTALPVYLVGALAIEIRQSLNFSATVLGFMISLYYVGAAVTSIPLSALPDRFGAARVIRTATLVCGACLLLVAVVVSSWVLLGALLFVSGGVSAATVAATNQFLARRVRFQHQGMAFGVKQAAIPAASLLGGLAVPAIAITIGWRWAFVVATSVAVLASFLISGQRTVTATCRHARIKRPTPELERAPLVLLGAGLGLGLFAATGLNAFLVTASVQIGLSQSTAGFLLAATGMVAAGSRILVGRQADRWTRNHLAVVGAMLAAGTFGYLALVIGTVDRIPLLFVAGSLLALGIGWGWNGLFNFALTRAYQHAPARATGVTQVGGRVGGLIGPAAVGVIAGHISFTAAWSLAASAEAAAVLAIFIGRRMLEGTSRSSGPPNS